MATKAARPDARRNAAPVGRARRARRGAPTGASCVGRGAALNRRVIRAVPAPAPVRTSVAETYDLLAPARARLRARDAAIVRLQVELAQIPAPTGDETARGRRVAVLLAAPGLRDVRVDAAGNVLGLRPGSTGDAAGRAVVVCAHLDTVFPAGTPLTVRREGPRLVGPGIGDNSRGLAVMLAVARELDGVRVRTR